jgi:hypothetical protein
MLKIKINKVVFKNFCCSVLVFRFGVAVVVVGLFFVE